MTDVFPPGSRVCAYVRDSGASGQELSTRQQEISVGDWCHSHGYVLSRIFKDEARSGKQLAGRDAFISMMDYLDGKTPEVGLLLWGYDRLARDFDDSAYYLADLRRKGYTVYSITDNIPDNLEGRLLGSIIAWKNARYLEDLRKNVIRGQHYVTSQHHAWFVRPPIGYRKVEKNIGNYRDGSSHIIHSLDLDPELAPIVLLAFQLRSQGMTYSEIHQKVHLFPWLQSYAKLFRNEIYTGNYHNDLWNIENFCPPIVEPELWNAVQKVNTMRRGASGYNHPRAIRSRYLLSGLLHCSKCGLSMNGMGLRVGNNRFYYYVCTGRSRTENKCDNRYVRQDEIEPKVINAIKSMLLDKRILQEIYDEINEQLDTYITEQSVQIAALKGELSSMNSQISRLVSAIKETGHSIAMLNSLAELEKSKAELEQEIARLDIPQDTSNIDVDKIIEYITQELENEEPSRLVEVLRSIIRDIRVFKGETISGNIECQLPEMGDKSIVIPL